MNRVIVPQQSRIGKKKEAHNGLGVQFSGCWEHECGLIAYPFPALQLGTFVSQVEKAL
jgi:hypothetical protein